MCYNGIYHLYKMNSQGNWVKIHQKQSNDSTIFVHLEQTDLNNANLRVLSDDGNRIYHHFKVITENTFWLSETPDEVSKGWDAALNRICTYGLFSNKKTKQLKTT